MEKRYSETIICPLCQERVSYDSRDIRPWLYHVVGIQKVFFYDAEHGKDCEFLTDCFHCIGKNPNSTCNTIGKTEFAEV